MFSPFRAVRGPTIRAMLARMALVAVALVVVLAVVRIAGQRVSSSRYHQAAVTEVARIEPASRLLTEMLNAQTAVQGYITTIDPFRLLSYSESFERFALGVNAARKANADAPEVLAHLDRLNELANEWRTVNARALQIANIGRIAGALRMTRGRLNPFINEHRGLMGRLQQRRLDAVSEADRWGATSYWISNAAIGLGGLVLVFFAVRIARRVLGPLGSLQEATARIAQGRAGEPVPVHPQKDEIHDLAAGFNAMELDLAAARRQLEARAAELEEANRLKGEFVANVSHELRTPLSSIIGYSQLLLDTDHHDLTEEQHSDVTTILTAAEHLLVLINDVLDMARIDAGQLEVAPEPCDARELAREACQAVATLAHAKGLALVRDLPREPVPAFCDPGRVRQVLLNLLGNAVKFTDAGSVTVRVEAAGPWSLLIVADTGPGIPEDQIAGIWHEFRQVDGSLTRRRGGTGLGLAITRHLVGLQGGTITCESEVGAGATFTVALPAHGEGGNGAPATRLARPAPPGARVLLVEDNPDSASLMARWLRGAGYQPEIATSAEAALQVLEKGPPPDCIVLDLILPGLDGFGLLSRLRERPGAADVPVVITSMLDERARGLALGATEYLNKPVDRAELLRAVERSGATIAEHGVLVVDDDPAALELLVRWLSPLGPVHQARDGNEGLALLRQLRPAAAVIDLMMPGMSGLELIAAARQDPALAATCLIAVSAKILSPGEALQLTEAAVAMLPKAGLARESLLAEVSRQLMRDRSTPTAVV
jgi:signal transduction histidine kinase/CheY-like chemotaxis protein